MSRENYYYMWIPEMLKLTDYFWKKIEENEKKKNIEEKGKCPIDNVFNRNSEEISKDHNIPFTESEFIKGTGKYVYWNHHPNMIIDLDWVEINKKHSLNIILP
jgi:hypothetical protein